MGNGKENTPSVVGVWQLHVCLNKINCICLHLQCSVCLWRLCFISILFLHSFKVSLMAFPLVLFLHNRYMNRQVLLTNNQRRKKITAQRTVTAGQNKPFILLETNFKGVTPSMCSLCSSNHVRVWLKTDYDYKQTSKSSSWRRHNILRSFNSVPLQHEGAT